MKKKKIYSHSLDNLLGFQMMLFVTEIRVNKKIRKQSSFDEEEEERTS
jgi:hypothetical protein